MAPADEWRYANSASADRGGDGDLRPPSGAWPPQKRRHGGAGDGDLPKPPVHFVSAAVSSSSDEHGDSRNLASSSVVPPRQAAEPGSLASNAVVARMMKRMNYKEGTGLGRHGQGIVAPIEVALRPKNAGLGTVERSAYEQPPPPPPGDDGNWPKWDEAGGGARKRKRGRDRFESEDKIVARRLQEIAGEAVVRVQKALARSSSTSRPGDETAAAAAAITRAMKWVQEQSASRTLTTGELVREFAALKDKFPQEYAAYRLGDTARAIAAPLLRAVFRRWEPLEDPSRGLATVTALRDVLSGDGYGALVDDAVVPPALASAADTWEAKDPDPMIRFLDTWGDALPLPAIQRVLEQAVMPKLSAAVEQWEPRWEPVPPCHVWLQRWIPLLGRRWLEPLFATVRRKLGEALQGWHWHPARAMADHAMVLPWKEAFGKEAWEELVARHVVPYLRRGVRALRVAPPKQDDGGGGGGFAAVMRWASVVPARDVARLLDEEFFGRWQDALRRWLCAERPTVAEAIAWHDGWTRLLTPELLADERVSVHIEAGLQKISRAAQGLEIYRRERGHHAGDGEAYPCRSRSRWRAVVRSGSKRRH